MIARVLIINQDKLGVSSITSKLEEFYCSLSFARSVEDSLRIVGAQYVDVVFLSLPKNFSENSSKSFLDFFSVLKQSCGVIPIIGLVESDEQEIPSIALEDVLRVDIEKSNLIRRMNALIKMKNLFDDNLLNNMCLDRSAAQKIVTIFHDNIDFLHKSILENTEVVMLRTWPVIDNVSDSDLFIINANHTQANECCTTLRLRKMNRHKPIIFTFDKRSKERMSEIVELDIGYTDIIDIESNPIVIKHRLNSFIRYKKLYEAFSQKLKKSLYLSAIDPTTEVYNRSFLDEYLKSRERAASNAAVIMLDVDKFKAINDKFGHAFADSMLKHVSGMIKRYIRSSDVIARYGGDEFVIIMNNVAKSTAEDIAARIRKRICDSLFCNEQCSVSIGVCCVGPESSASLREAISPADKFMYAAKESGGNSVKVCV